MESEPDQLRRPMGCAGIAGIGIVLLYVLSIGPAFRMLNLSYLSESTIEVAYAPLIWLSDHSEIGDEALRVYLDIWAEYGTYPMWKGKRVARKYYPPPS